MKPSLYLLKNTPENLWAVSVKNPEAPEILKGFAATARESRLPTYRVLIAYPDQLHNFVQRIPSLAWELLEYAHEPLEIIYPEKKDTVKHGENSPTICVRWVKQPKLLTYLRKSGPLWAVPASFETEPPEYREVECRDKKYPYQRVRTITIAQDGTFSFLR